MLMILGLSPFFFLLFENGWFDVLILFVLIRGGLELIVLKEDKIMMIAEN